MKNNCAKSILLENALYSYKAKKLAKIFVKRKISIARFGNSSFQHRLNEIEKIIDFMFQIIVKSIGIAYQLMLMCAFTQKFDE